MACHSDPNTLSLASFVKHYGHCLPLVIRVEEGFCGDEERSVVSSGDIYNFHFVRNEKIISIQDSDGMHFSIPFNSSISFGLVYNPFNEPIQSFKQYFFTSVADIISCKCPPQIIRATKEFNGNDPKTSIKKEEILVVKKICRNGKKRKQHLRVHSLLTGGEKTLYRDCTGHFLTDPGSVRLYIPEIVEFFEKSFPLVAKVFLNSDVSDDSISRLVSDIVTIMHSSIESSIIATTCWNDESNQSLLVKVENDNNLCMPLAIPTDLNITVSIIGSQTESNEELYKMTRQLFEDFQTEKIKNTDVVPVASCVKISTKTLHGKLNCSVREGHERQGVEIEKPRKVYMKSKSTHRCIEDPLLKPLDFQPTRVHQKIDSERHCPSISYSTFTNDPRLKPLKSSNASTSSQEYSGTSPTSGSSIIQTNATFEDNLYQGMVYSLGCSKGVHPLSDVTSGRQSPTDCSSNYDIPKKIASLSTRIAAPDLGGSYKSYVTSKSVPHNITYDVPHSCIRATPSASFFVENDLQLSLPNNCDQSTSNLLYTRPTSNCKETALKSTVPITDLNPTLESSSDHLQVSNSSKQTLSLTELIKRHPLIKHPIQEIIVNGKTLSSNTAQDASHHGSSFPSDVVQLSHSEDQEVSLVTPTLKNPISIKKLMVQDVNVNNPTNRMNENMRSQLFLHDVHMESHKYSSSVSLTTDKKTVLSNCKRQSTDLEDTDVVYASMNRAQTLIARNIKELKKLDCQKVQMLLEFMNLGQYKQRFLSEEIDGEILAECDEQILLHELNVSSEIHRLHIMNIIAGKQSVALILSGQGTYNYAILSS